MYRLALGLLATVIWPHVATAGEAASSNYTPGAYGDFGLAVPNAPGVEFTLISLAALGLDTNIVDPTTGAPADIQADAWVGALTVFWTAGEITDGITFAASATATIVDVEVSAELDFGNFGRVVTKDDRSGFGDLALNPITLYGDFGSDATRFYWSLAEFITAPTGRFSPNRLASPGRNHWSFDTVAAASWIDLEAGYELGLAAGFLANLENPDTNYRSGHEAHADVVANVLVGGGFALGVTAYGVAQVEKDSGAGAGAAPLKGHAWGAGLQAFWTPDLERFTPSVRLKWLHDFQAKDRLAGDYLFLTVEFPLN